jgi:hypothetical protein
VAEGRGNINEACRKIKLKERVRSQQRTTAIPMCRSFWKSGGPTDFHNMLDSWRGPDLATSPSTLMNSFAELIFVSLKTIPWKRLFMLTFLKFTKINPLHYEILKFSKTDSLHYESPNIYQKQSVRLWDSQGLLKDNRSVKNYLQFTKSNYLCYAILKIY